MRVLQQTNQTHNSYNFKNTSERVDSMSLVTANDSLRGQLCPLRCAPGAWNGGSRTDAIFLSQCEGVCFENMLDFDVCIGWC